VLDKKDGFRLEMDRDEGYVLDVVEDNKLGVA
jgi:hypothetical protein